MKVRLMLIVVGLVAAILLIPPWVSLNDMEVDDKTTAHVWVTANCAFYRDWDTAFTIEMTQSQAVKPSYWDYFGDFWSGGSLSVVPPSEYPYFQVLIKVNLEVVMEYYEPYTYGDTATWNGDYIVESGDTVYVQAQIYWAQASGDYVSETYMVV